MNKRKNKAVVATILIVFLMCAAALVMIMQGRRFKIKSGIITAAELDVTSVINPDTTQPQNDIETLKL